MTPIAFYAPLKPPDHHVPSGDRRMARLLAAALGEAGFAPTLACRFRTHAGTAPERQPRIAAAGRWIAGRLAKRLAADAGRPRAWFTYHLYHKAPDHFGPAIAEALGIPYFVAEASYAPKRAGGPWNTGHCAVAEAVRAANAIFCINPNDRACLLPLVEDPARLIDLPPFLDHAPYRAAHEAKATHRAVLAGRPNLHPDVPLLLAVGMMRDGDKLASYRLLAHALARLSERPWELLIAGDGPAREAVRTAFDDAGVAGRIRMLGEVTETELPALYAASDLMVWPAVREAYGMALLEAQATGLPVVAGRTDGVPAIVADGRTGLLVPPGDSAAFAAAVASLLDDGPRREALGRCALEGVARDHTLASAAAILRRGMEAWL